MSPRCTWRDAKGATIAVTFQHVATGTRIAVVQSGFHEAFVESAGEAFWTHADAIAAGFRAFFERVTPVEGRPRSAGDRPVASH